MRNLPLIDLLSRIKKNYKIFLFFIFFGMLLGFFLASFVAPKFKGEIVFSMGSFLNGPLTSNQEFLYKIKNESFYSDDSKKACLDSSGFNIFPEDKNINFYLDNSIGSDNNLISIKISGFSKQVVFSCLNSIFSDIHLFSKNILDSKIKLEMYEYQSVKALNDLTMKQLTEINNLGLAKAGKETQSLIQTKIELQQKLLSGENLLKTTDLKLQAPFTQAAFLIAPLNVNQERDVFFQKFMIVMLFTILGAAGFFLSLMFKYK